jgi:hypothetical protein
MVANHMITLITSKCLVTGDIEAQKERFPYCISDNNCHLELPHKNNEKLPIISDFTRKKATFSHFFLKMSTFFCFFFAENVVLLIFAQRN